MTLNIQRLKALLYKEMVQLLRDRRTLLLLFALPIIQLFLFAYAVSLTVDHLPTAIFDQSNDPRSRDVIQSLVNSGYFDVKITADNEQQIVKAMDSGRVKVGVVIPPDFSDTVARGQGNFLLLLDGSDSFSVQSGYSAASAIAQKYSLSLASETVQKTGKNPNLVNSLNNLTVSTATRVLYNPDMNGLIFILPGLIAMIIQNIIVAHSALAVVREREAGTLEQLLATPARPLEMLIAKLIPGLLVVMVDMVLTLFLGVFALGVPFRGDLGLFFLLSILFIISGMGLGLMVSTVSKTQRQAQQLTQLINVFAMLLTGFIYPRNTMPVVAQWIGDLIPMTYFLRIARGIITRGVGINFIWPDALALVVYSAVLILMAAVVTRKRLD
jgi:ABC-2 type transport system permease protein